MNFEKQMAVLIQRYIKDTEQHELSIEEILKRPRWKRVWFWWKALEKYEGKPFPELSLEEVKSIYGD